MMQKIFTYILIFSLTFYTVSYYKLKSEYDNLTLDLCVLYSTYTLLHEGISRRIAPPFVTVTTYNSTQKQTDSTPNITAFNKKVKPGTVAVSRDLLSKGFLPGSKIYLEGYGMYTVADVMGRRHKESIDIWLPLGMKPFKKEKVRVALVVGDIVKD